MFQTRSTHGATKRTTALLTGIAVASALVAGGVSAIEMSFDTAPTLGAVAETVPAA